MIRRPIKMGDTVYHRSVYKHNEALKVIGILEDKLLLEGDFSGGTHAVKQSEWLPLKGTSRVKNHTFKLKARQEAIDIAIEVKPNTPKGSLDSTSENLIKMVNNVLALTRDVELNPEY